MNPLDSTEAFRIGLMNPNPTSSKTAKGPIYRVSFELEQDDWQLFMDGKTSGMVLACMMQVVPDTGEPEKPSEPEKPVKGPHGEFAQWIVGSGVLRMPVLWEVLGTEENHKEWIQKKKCFICGGGDYVEKTGELLCEEAHIRRADNSGVSTRPDYISVPMCHEDHALQHQKGENALIDRYLEYHPGPAGEGVDWFRELLLTAAMKFTSDWAKEKIYEHFAIVSLTWLEPVQLKIFVDANRITINIPEKFGV